MIYIPLNGLKVFFPNKLKILRCRVKKKRGLGRSPKVLSALELDHELQPIDKAKKIRNEKKNSNTIFANRTKKIN